MFRCIITLVAVYSIGYYILAQHEMTTASPVTFSLEPQQTSTNSDILENIAMSTNTIIKQIDNRQLNSNMLSTVTILTTSETMAPPYTVLNDNYPFRYIINNREICDTDEQLKLVMVVFSAPMNFATRLAIRKTWGVAAVRKDVSMVFLLGATSDTEVQEKLVDEDKLYGDMVQEDFVDTYRNLTLTLTTVALLRWASVFCMNAQFVMKVDDDNFVNVPNLLDFLAKNKDRKKVIYGKIWHKVKPDRGRNSKWFISEEDYKGDSYPDYTGGPSYVISMDSVQGLLDAASKLKSFPLEDAFITGVCAEYANVSRVNDDHFQVSTDVAAPCTFRNLIAAHGVPPSSLFIAWWYTNDHLFDTCDVAKDKQTCTQQARHVFVDMAGLLSNKMVQFSS